MKWPALIFGRRKERFQSEGGRFFELVSRSIFMFVHMYVRGEKVCDVTAGM